MIPTMSEKESRQGKNDRSAKYDKKTARYYRLKLNKKTDKDLIEKLDSVGNVQGYIKVLISDDIQKNRKESEPR